MAKIDTTLIEGYESMSTDEKLAALESFEMEIPKPDYTGYVKKDKLDKAAHDAAEWKKKYNAQLSDDEKARQELIEANESMKAELATMKRDKNISLYTAQFTSQGYDVDLAASTATAMADGDMDTVFANQQKFIDQLKADAEKAKIKSTGKPGAAGGDIPTEVTKADFLKMSYSEKMAYKAEHPNWAAELK